MPDPICRWRNPYLPTVREFIGVLPRVQMPSAEARQQITAGWDDTFFRTPYQLACQLGLYYEEGGVYYPRFTEEPSLDDILLYLKNWILKYYVPNPYTNSFEDLGTVTIHSKLCSLLRDAGGTLLWETAKNETFGAQIGNDDILKNTINLYSPILTFTGANLSLKAGTTVLDLPGYITPEVALDRNDKKIFFDRFNIMPAIQPAVRPIIIPNAAAILPLTVPRNKIIYGAPGTGKSYELRRQVQELGFTTENMKRITFHPNYTYQQFIGTYKPTPVYRELEEGHIFYGTDKVTRLEAPGNKEPFIDYSFVHGPLLKHLAEAITNADQNYLIIVEEINRAPVSAVFGDFFQLLDRDDDGVSEYGIELNSDASSYLRSLGIDAANVRMPQNLFIWATMNSADQGVMPMDAAFKRRWAFEYLPLNSKEGVVADRIISFQGRRISWNHFRTNINKKLTELGIAEDKLVGPFFLNKAELANSSSIKNKLLLYLRDDVVRHNVDNLFKQRTFSDIITEYDKGNEIFQEIAFEEAAADAPVLQENPVVQ